jgi:hypothetical protein
MTINKNVFKEESYKYVPTADEFRKFGESTHGKGKHKAHRVDDSISFRTPRGRKSGRVVEVHKEYYIVNSGGVMHKINRNSILYSLGTFLGRVSATHQSFKKAYEFGKNTRDEDLEDFKTKYRNKRRKP